MDTWRPECLVLNAHGGEGGVVGTGWNSWIPNFHLAPTKLLQVNACGTENFVRELLEQDDAQWLVLVMWPTAVDDLVCIAWTDTFWPLFLRGSDFGTAYDRGVKAAPEGEDGPLPGSSGPSVWSRGDVGLCGTWDSMMAHLPVGVPALLIDGAAACKEFGQPPPPAHRAFFAGEE